jgi:hypothetical protein
MQVIPQEQPGPEVVHVVGPPSYGLGPPTKVDQTRFYRAVHVGCRGSATPMQGRVVLADGRPRNDACVGRCRSPLGPLHCDQAVTTAVNMLVTAYGYQRRGTSDPTVKQAA